jgi:5'-nucleotidase
LSAALCDVIRLITNDDGITAPGIRNLIEAVKDLGKIVVVAPDKAQSGMGHAITIGVPLRLHKVNFLMMWKPGSAPAHL